MAQSIGNKANGQRAKDSKHFGGRRMGTALKQNEKKELTVLWVQQRPQLQTGPAMVGQEKRLKVLRQLDCDYRENTPYKRRKQNLNFNDWKWKTVEKLKYKLIVYINIQ